MTKSKHWQWIPTSLTLEQFDEFVLPHLTRGRRGPPVKLTLHKIFNYILQQLYLGCQWKSLPIERRTDGLAEIHYTSIYKTFRRWTSNGFGLILFSFIISVLSAALEQLIESIQGGARPYRNRGHLLIVNRNDRLALILDEINERYRRRELDVDVVLLLSDRAEVAAFCEGQDLTRWPFLHIFVRQGDLLDFESYRRVLIFAASGIILLTAGVPGKDCQFQPVTASLSGSCRS